jgi:serine/threonine protein kinase
MPLAVSESAGHRGGGLLGRPPEDNAGLAAGDGVGPGSKIAGYLIEERVGRGGMAVVFRARDERLGRQVALKVLAAALAEDTDFRQRFIRESRAAAAVDDPHIIPVFEAGEASGVLFIAMRYVAGGDVRSLLRRSGPLPTWRVAAILSPVAAALDAAHAAGLVHRDVKPANMLIDTRPGRPDHVYLSDFGLSKAALSSVGLTGSGLFLGTPDYISPEQIAGRAVDGRADQYSLACTAFELLTGTPPFPRDHGMAVIYAHASEPAPLLTSRRPELPSAADGPMARALAKEPADRYLTCQEFADSLRAALGLPTYETHPATGDGEPEGERTARAVAVVPYAGAGTEEAETRSASPRPPASPPDGSPERAAVQATEPSAQAVGGARQGSDPHGKTAPTAAHSRRLRLSRRTAAIAVSCVVLAAAVTVGLLASHSAPPAGSPQALGPTHSPAASPTARAGSPSPAVRYVVTSQTARMVVGGYFSGIAAVPGGGGAWAVGHSLPAIDTLICRWNGTAWTQVPSPNPAPGSELTAVAATSASDAWAVGFYIVTANGLQNGLIEHWDGTAWTQVPSPHTSIGSQLTGVSAVSPTNAWAVGYTFTAHGPLHSLIEHWDGTAWTRVPSPSGGDLLSVAATSPTNAWAVGDTAVGANVVILHWDGIAWNQMPTPSTDSGALTGLSGVTAASGASAWAVGSTSLNSSDTSVAGVVLRWNGTVWQQVGSPKAAYPSEVAAISPTSAWVVGGTGLPYFSSTRTLIMRWNDTPQT